jgi:hypothetical protein
MMDKIYSNKSWAVMREVSCNALDAHKMNGQTKPFDVIMPSYVEPTLTIRDYGPGLSKEDVLEIYTCFGESTKSNSNDYVGALGLGSKSPFSYTDNFTVVSHHGGVSMSFAMFKDADGVPQVTFIGEEPGTETGLEVRVPVKQEDFGKFVEAARTTFRYFPEGTYNLIGTTVDRPNVVMSGTGWEVVDGSRDTVVVMGPVAYSVDFRAIYGSSGYGHDHPSKSVVFHAEMGTLDIQPSREALSYDETTIANLKTLIEGFKKEIKQKLIDEVSGAKTRWESVDVFKKARANLSYLGSSIVPTTIHHPKFGEVTTAGYKVSIAGDNRVRHFGKSDIHLLRPKHEFMNNESFFVDPGQILFIWDDLDPKTVKFPKWVERVSLFCERKQCGGPNAAYNGKKNVVVLHNFASIADVAKELDCPITDVIFKASDFEPPVTAKGVTIKDPSLVTIFVERKYKNYNEPDWEKCGSSNRPTGAGPWYYLPMNNSTCEVSAWKAVMRHPLLAGKTVFGLTKRAQAELDMDNWIRADEYIIERAKTEIADPGALADLAAVQFLEMELYALEEPQAGLYDFARRFPTKTGNILWDQLVDSLGKLQAKDMERVRRIQAAVSGGLIQLPALPAVDDPRKCLKALADTQPLFTLVVNKISARTLSQTEAKLVLKTLEI